MIDDTLTEGYLINTGFVLREGFPYSKYILEIKQSNGFGLETKRVLSFNENMNKLFLDETFLCIVDSKKQFNKIYTALIKN